MPIIWWMQKPVLLSQRRNMCAVNYCYSILECGMLHAMLWARWQPTLVQPFRRSFTKRCIHNLWCNINADVAENGTCWVSHCGSLLCLIISLFWVSTPEALKNWKKYFLALSGSEIGHCFHRGPERIPNFDAEIWIQLLITCCYEAIMKVIESNINQHIVLMLMFRKSCFLQTLCLHHTVLLSKSFCETWNGT